VSQVPHRYEIDNRSGFTRIWCAGMAVIALAVIAVALIGLVGDPLFLGTLVLGGMFLAVAYLSWISANPGRNAAVLTSAGLNLTLFDLLFMRVRVDIPYDRIESTTMATGHSPSLQLAWPETPRTPHVDIRIKLRPRPWRLVWQAHRILRGDTIHLNVLESDHFLDDLNRRLAGSGSSADTP